jgi:hypothetical protein
LIGHESQHQVVETTMSRKRGAIPCPSCGEPIREKTLRCPSCGTTNPLQERPSLDERIGLGGTLVLVAVAGIILLVLGVWLTYELVALGRLNPYLVAAGGLVILVGVGARIARVWRK